MAISLQDSIRIVIVSYYPAWKKRALIIINPAPCKKVYAPDIHRRRIDSEILTPHDPIDALKNSKRWSIVSGYMMRFGCYI